MANVLRIAIVATLSLLPIRAPAQSSAALDAGYRDMYSLRFEAAHHVFADWQKAHPEDPLGPVSNAAAYLFAEFERLHVLESELFTDNNKFLSRSKFAPDPNAKASFDQELAKADALAGRKLNQDAHDADALFAKALAMGLRGDYAAMVEKRDLAGLSYMKSGRALAQQLLAAHPDYYDAYLAVGVENYLLSQQVAPMRWALRLSGAQTDKQTGLNNLRLTAEHGHYLLPYARLLLAVAALRDNDKNQARDLLSGLSREFPENHLYAKELAKLQQQSAALQH
jgi:hypothetical protein